MALVTGSEIAADTIVLRELKGSPLSSAEFDWDLSTLMGAINVNTAAALSRSDFLTVTNVAMAGGQSTLVVGVDIASSILEIINLSATAAETLSMINGATAGDIKIIVATGSNVTITRNDSYIKTKNPIADPSLPMVVGDVVGLLNVGGDPTVTAHGKWLEIFRALQV